MSRITRREFLGVTGATLAAAATTGVSAFGRDIFTSGRAPYFKRNLTPNRVVILGMDGMDPVLVRRFIAEGKLPTFAKMMERSHFGEIGTTTPPHSPVAWASFITGTNPGGNGIYDFVHRDPATFSPYMATSRSFDSSNYFDIGNWRLPLESGRVELMRRGTPFWQVLEENNIPSVICQIPANFPITPSATKALSGMGTPDLLGTYGTFTYYTDGNYDGKLKFAGGRVVKLRFRDDSVETRLEGPRNSLRVHDEDAAVDFTIDRDPVDPTVQITVQDQVIILKEKEWSDWTPVRFELMPVFASASGMVRFYLKQVRPHFELYVSPINVDPLEPTLPISSPASYSRELAESIGRFHTQGFPADTKALSRGFFSNDEFFHQSRLVFEESMKLFQLQYDRFNEGVFYFYFSTVDQGTHMMWRLMDPTHPLYEPNEHDELKNAVRYYYERMDDVLKYALTKVDQNTTLIALSDHGFSPFSREFNVSTWLLENGYTALTNPRKQDECDVYSHVNWAKSKAYGLGLNGIYINLKGREKRGWVSNEEATALKKEIAAKLVQVRDPQTGKPVISAVYDGAEIYSGPFTALAPDLVVGYHRGYRISDEAVLGKFPREIVSDRTDKWAADHCIDAPFVPGMLLTNRALTRESPGLWDMAPSILSLFGIATPAAMTGRTVW